MQTALRPSAVTEALRSAAKRVYAQRDLLAFCSAVYPDFQSPRHIELLAEILERVERGELKRVIISLHPGSGKSTLLQMFAAWYLGRDSRRKIIATSAAALLAMRNSRIVRDLVGADGWPFDVTLAKDSTASNKWETAEGGGLYALGAGGVITGWRSQLIICDDLEDGQSSKNELDSRFDWLTSKVLTRLEPGGAAIIIQCMTGDTAVEMSDGTERRLDTIRAGDLVATYDHGFVDTARVLGWRNCGPDDVYEITLRSGRTVRANSRHPFLVNREGVLKWVTLRNLFPGEHIVARIASIATNRRPANGAVPRTTGSRNARLVCDTHMVSMQIDRSICGVATGSDKTSSRIWLGRKAEPVRYASRRRLQRIPPNTGKISSVSTTITKPTSCAAFSATNATLCSGIPRMIRAYYALRRNTWNSKNDKPHSDFTFDEVVSIEAAGRANVYDVQIERTENFIASGLVSHNTRWPNDDLPARILESPTADTWTYFRIPAIAEGDDDLLGREAGEAMWPSRFDVPALLAIKAEIGSRHFEAQYQGAPSPDVGDLFKREWFDDRQRYTVLPRLTNGVMFLDGAVKEGLANDRSALAVWATDGVDYYLIDVWAGRLDYVDLRAKVKAFWAKWKVELPALVPCVEDASSGSQIIQEFKRTTNIPIVGVKVDKSKFTRAEAVTPLFEARKCYLPSDHPMLDDWIEEHVKFPAGKHDDLVDTTSGALARLGRSGSGPVWGVARSEGYRA